MRVNQDRPWAVGGRLWISKGGQWKYPSVDVVDSAKMENHPFVSGGVRAIGCSGSLVLSVNIDYFHSFIAHLSFQNPSLGLSRTILFQVTSGCLSCTVTTPSFGGGVRFSQIDEYKSDDSIVFQFSNKIACEEKDGNHVLPREWTPQISPPIEGTFKLHANTSSIVCVSQRSCV